MKKTTLILIASMLLLAGCSTSIVNYSTLDKPVTSVHVGRFIASDAATASMFENAMQTELENNGFTVSQAGDIVISGMITRNYYTVESAVITVKTRGKPVFDVEYYNDSGFGYSSLEAAKKIAGKTVGKLK